jgi:hypothetical protein
MLMALGYLPGVRADKATMRRTYQKVLDTWKFAALDALLMDTPKNHWLPNGHTWQRANLPVYLPSNGALLSAVALIASEPVRRTVR